VRANTSSSSRISVRSKASACLDRHLLCAHLHDREHVHHLCVAVLVCMVNVIMTIAVPSLGIQLIVTVGIFGHDAITTILS
jgi:hypothetical protein